MHEAAEEFVEQLSLHLEAYGLSKIAGRMLGYFLIDGGTHSLDDIAECLQVSKGSVSTNARLLEHRGLLVRCSRPGDRRDFYSLAGDPWHNMFEVAQTRMQNMGNLFKERAQKLPPEMEAAQERLGRWGDFYAFIVDDMDGRIERWEARDTEGAPEE